MSAHDFDNDRSDDNRLVTSYNNDFTTLTTCLFTTFGDVVGQAINDKIAQVVAMEGIDIQALESQLAVLNSLINANTAGDQVSAQSILAAIAAIGSRVSALEGSTAIAQLTAELATLTTALNAETQARLDADAQLQGNIDSLQSQYDQLSQSLVSIENQINSGGGTDCDCGALQAQISQLNTAVGNLQGSDSDKATLIASLQARVEALEVSAAGVASAVAAAAAAQATAQTALSNAAAAQASANAAAAAAAAASAAVSALEQTNTRHHGHFVTKAEMMDVNCENVINAATAVLRARLGLSS